MIATELPLLRGCRVLIVDPPRKGLDVEVVDYLCQEGWRGNMKLVVYVSCGFRAFQRDCDALMRSVDVRSPSRRATCSPPDRVLSTHSHFLFRRRKDFSRRNADAELIWPITHFFSSFLLCCHHHHFCFYPFAFANKE